MENKKVIETIGSVNEVYNPVKFQVIKSIDLSILMASLFL
jgi:lipoprotein-releasing system ATP-binding protein